jgi:hypothetical protein
MILAIYSAPEARIRSRWLFGLSTHPEYENQWRPEIRQEENRIQFGYDSAYEEMRARGNNANTLDTDLGFAERPQNTQFRIGF